MNHDVAEVRRRYWETQERASEIAAACGARSFPALAKMAGPYEMSFPCDECGGRLLATSRANRDFLVDQHHLVGQNVMSVDGKLHPGASCEKCSVRRWDDYQASRTRLEEKLAGQGWPGDIAWMYGWLDSRSDVRIRRTWLRRRWVIEFREPAEGPRPEPTKGAA